MLSNEREKTPVSKVPVELWHTFNKVMNGTGEDLIDLVRGQRLNRYVKAGFALQASAIFIAHWRGGEVNAIVASFSAWALYGSIRYLTKTPKSSID